MSPHPCQHLPLHLCGCVACLLQAQAAACLCFFRLGSLHAFLCCGGMLIRGGIKFLLATLAENNIGTCSFACCCTETLRDIWHKIAPKLAQRNAARPMTTLAASSSGSAATPVHLHCWPRLCFDRRCCIFGIYLAFCLEFPGGRNQGVLNLLHMLLSAFCGTGKLCQGQRCSVQHHGAVLHGLFSAEGKK